MCDARKQRGVLIAAVCKIVQRGKVWLVPSSNGEKKYTVCPDEQSPYCSCLDHETRGVECKHIHAVRLVVQREQHSDGSETVTETVTITQTLQRKTYPQDWPNYNAAQVNEKILFQSLLRSLCDLVKEQPGKPVIGRPRIPLSDCIFMSCFKVYSTVSQRRFMCDLDDAQKRGHLEKTPHFNAIGKSLENESLTPVLEKLITTSSLPLKEVETDFAVDSTGFTSSKFYRWLDHKYGKIRQEHTWVKLHFACGVKTNVVTAVEIRERNAADCPILPDLVNATHKNFTVKEVSADKAYASELNFRAIAAIGADPFIPFRANTTAECGGLYQKAFHFFSLYREEFLQSYHKRSNIESTVSAIKRKFGDHVRSKNETAMKNEVLCKVLCHNICVLISAMYELGIEPKFLSA